MRKRQYGDEEEERVAHALPAAWLRVQRPPSLTGRSRVRALSNNRNRNRRFEDRASREEGRVARKD